MSSIGGVSAGYGILGTLIANASVVHQNLDKLTEQVSTGMVAQTYAGLGANSASVSINLNLQLNTIQTYQSNINQASGTMQVTQTAMTQIQQIAAQFVADMPKLNNAAPTETDSVAADARQALTQVAQLLDTQDGDNYVFGGQDTANPPVPNPGSILSTGFYTQINAQISNLSSYGSDVSTLTQNTLDIASSNDPATSPFSSYMSNAPNTIPAQVVQTGEGGTVQIGLLASGNSVAVSGGTSTTGSYMRDLMRALATIGSLSSSQANDPGFAALVQDTTTSLNGAVTAMATDVGVLGDTQANLTSTQSELTATTTALTGQVSNVQNVDMTTTLSNLTAAQTQLQASYRLISGENSMSLVNFLPASG